jgi:hypothetical protein
MVVVEGNAGTSLLGSLTGGCPCAFIALIKMSNENIMDSFFIYLVTFPVLINICRGLIVKKFGGKDNILF